MIDGAADVSLRHQALVDALLRAGHIRSPRVEAAFRAVPRHVFLPGIPLDEVYRDQVIVTKRADGFPISSSSQPAMMAIMLEQLAPEPGHRVLEIGAGTGYNAALLAHVVDETGRVVTVDIDQDLADGAQRHLDAAGFARVHVVCGDGGLGYAPGAPYDRIILTVGAADVLPAWREQLTPGGRLVLPLSLKGPQRSVAFDDARDHLVSVSVRDCDFMRLRGAWAEAHEPIALGPEPGLLAWVDDRDGLDPDGLYAALTGPGQDVPTGVRVTAGEVFSGLLLWLALRETGRCGLVAHGVLADRGLVPRLFGPPGTYRFTTGVRAGASLALLARASDPAPEPPPPEEPPPPFELIVRRFGLDGTPAERLVTQVRAWDATGRPGTRGLRIRAYPRDAGYRPVPGELVVDQPWTRLVLDWPEANP